MMHRYVIEREMPGVGGMNAQQMRDAAEKSNKVLADLGTGVQWIESYVSADKIYCVYLANNEDIVRKHAEISGFPADRVSLISRVMDPTTGG